MIQRRMEAQACGSRLGKAAPVDLDCSLEKPETGLILDRGLDNRQILHDPLEGCFLFCWEYGLDCSS